MIDDFIRACVNLNVEPVLCYTFVTDDVYNELESICKEEDTSVEEFLRDI